MCTSKKRGGLGIRSLEILNKSLLGKWNWRLAIEDNPPWKDQIKLKYGLEEGGGSWWSQGGVLGWASGRILGEKLNK